MLAKAKELLEYRNGMVAIHPSHNKLIISLRTTVENGEGSLDKEATSHDKLVNKRPAADTDVTLRYMILLNKEIVGDVSFLILVGFTPGLTLFDYSFGIFFKATV